ncbi:MAG: Endonuclease, partial [uncultured Thermomicrobiales bacterium]
DRPAYPAQTPRRLRRGSRRPSLGWSRPRDPGARLALRSGRDRSRHPRWRGTGLRGGPHSARRESRHAGRVDRRSESRALAAPRRTLPPGASRARAAHLARRSRRDRDRSCRAIAQGHAPCQRRGRV